MIGKLMAELISGEEPSLPINKLDVGRFARGELIIERATLEGV
jgi:glycine/D-amino acid oxidase-like deaminating enzyme